MAAAPDQLLHELQVFGATLDANVQAILAHLQSDDDEITDFSCAPDSTLERGASAPKPRQQERPCAGLCLHSVLPNGYSSSSGVLPPDRISRPPTDAITDANKMPILALSSTVPPSTGALTVSEWPSSSA